MGVSVYPNDGESASMLLKNADIAMYKAKMEGRNRYKFFDQEMNQETNEHLEVEKSLYKALAPGAKPRYDTVLKLLHALGVKLSASPVHLG